MKYPHSVPDKTSGARAAAMLLAASIAAALPAAASTTDLATAPLASSTSGSVKPNISFVMDASGSMAWSHAPDESEPFDTQIGYKAAQCNSIYYRPDIVYVVPKHADATDFPNSSFTAAWTDGYNTGAGTVNLSTSFFAYNNTTSNGNGTDTAQPAYYYTYSGTQIPDFQNQASQFYFECNLAPTTVAYFTLTLTGSGTTTVSSIKVNGVETMTGTSSSSSSLTTEASRIATRLAANGFSATSNGATVLVLVPTAGSVGATPAITKSGGMTITPTKVTANPFTKHVVNATSGPGGVDERQNFANWFSYYRTRILMMKSGAGRAFASIGSSYRVGFMTIQATPSTSTTDPEYLKINDFDTTQKTTWYSKFYAMSPNNATPLKFAYSKAGRNFAGKLGPDPVQYSCQQNFVILTTDGYWNAGSPNPVGVTGGALSPASQDSNIALTPRPMYDGQVSGASNTLADAAAYYYNTDIRNASFSNCTSALTGLDVCQDNVPTSGLDTASTQHVTTFTLGLGTNGKLRFTNDYLTGGSADFNSIVSGGIDWPLPVGDTLTTIDDLWHAAVNGHGRYFAAKNPDLLVSGLRTALAGVSQRVASGAAAATSNLEPVAGDNFAYVANYRTVSWDGELQARTIDLSSGQISTTPVWSAQALLDANVSAATDSRTIFTFLAGTKVPFVPASFTAAQKTAWFSPTTAPTLSQVGGWTAIQTTAATPDTVINFLRGQNGNEERTLNVNQLYRLREHVLGDIIDGKPVYVKKPPFNYLDSGYLAFKASVAGRRGVVYAAANDGMLHAFDSLTGQEIWAYVPSFVLPNMKALADDNYANAHQYFVDGSPVATDIFNGSAWKTILVGGLGGGGKGYYALDITDPNAPTVLWEFSDANLGFSYGNPIIGKLTDGSWVVVVASGYNNADGVGRLYVINAATGALRFTVATPVGTPSSPAGLARISGVAFDALTDNTIDRVYGGDLLGNLWRFDLNDTFPPSGREATKLASFLVAGVPQPVTTAPEIGSFKDSSGATKFIAFVGTGRYLGTSDLSNTSQQSFYAIMDGGVAGTPPPVGDIRNAPACSVVKQTITVLDASHRSTSQTPVDFNTNCAWYLDFNPGNSSPGERVNVDPVLQLGVLAVATNVPEVSVCTLGGTSWLYFFDFLTGRFVTTSAGNVAGTKIGNSITVGLNTFRLQDGRVITTPTQSDDTRNPFGNPYNPVVAGQGKRAMWRELLN